jgi:hypothetical protein
MGQGRADHVPLDTNPLYALIAPQGFVSIQYFTDTGISDSYSLCLIDALRAAHARWLTGSECK